MAQQFKYNAGINENYTLNYLKFSQPHSNSTVYHMKDRQKEYKDVYLMQRIDRNERNTSL